MKRASFDLHQSDKHQRLLQEFLDLQKEFVSLVQEFVSKKRELHNAKENRDTLIAEIRFLRRRHKYLLQTRSFQPTEQVKDIVHHQKPVTRRKSQGSGRKNCGYDAALDNRNPFLVQHSNSSEKLEKSGVADTVKVVEKKPYIDYIVPNRKVKKKSTKTMIDDKRIGKKKMVWQDSLSLKV